MESMDNPYLILDLCGERHYLIIKYDASCRFFTDAFYQVEELSSYS